MKPEDETLTLGARITPDPRTMVFHLFVLGLFLIVSACSMAPMTEEEIYERETARNEVEDDYMMREMACNDIGGVMVFNHYSTYRKKQKLTAAQMKSAHCVRSAAEIGDSIY